MKNLLLLSTALSVGAVPGAWAQDADNPADKDDIEVITVTAQFREQSVTDVPIAITAYDGNFLDTIGVDEFDELSAFTPGFVVQEQSVNNPGFVLRGITSDDGASNIEPRVSVFQNGVSISRSRGSIVQLFDLERVEVLKGPQGTLFGRSAQIGAVHVITNKPKNEFEGGAEAEFGNLGQVALNGYVNVPLVDERAAFRVAATYETRDGFIDNTEGDDLNGTDSFAARASLRLTPSDTFTFDLIGHYATDNPPGTSFKSGVIPALGGTTDPNDFASLNTFGGFLGGADLSVDREIFDITAIASWQVNDSWSVVTTAAYREFDSLEIFDPDGTAFDIFIFAEDAEGEQFSADTRISYDDGGRFRGFFGGGVFYEEGSQAVPLGFDIGNTVALFSSLAAVGPAADGTAFFGGSLPIAQAFLSGDPAVLAATLGAAGIPQGVFQIEEFTNFSDNSSFDIFGEIEYDLTDRLTFTAGGRFTRDDKETLFASGISQPNPVTPLIIGSPALLVGDTGGIVSSDAFSDIDNSFTGFSWRAVLRYEISDNANVYANYSRGRRPQVIEDNFTTLADGSAEADFIVIPDETVDSYEIGAKGSFFEDRLTLDVAAYYYDYTNFQTTVTVDAGPGVPPDFVLVNGGTADSIGVEAGLLARPVENLDIFATYAYNRGRFDDFDADGNPQIFAGNQFRLSPDHSFSVGFNFEYPTEVGTFYITPTYTWKSSVFFEDENQTAFNVIDPASGSAVFGVPSVSQGSFGLLNIRGGVRLFDDMVELQVYVENALDEDFIIDGGNTGGAFGIPTFIAGPPIFYGGGISVKF